MSQPPHQTSSLFSERTVSRNAGSQKSAAAWVAKQTLFLGDTKVLDGLALGAWSVAKNSTRNSALLRADVSNAKSLIELPLGRITGLNRFTSMTRRGPFWVHPANGYREDDARPGTLWLLAELEDYTYTLLVPLLEYNTSFSLRGGPRGLILVGETGDSTVSTNGGNALFVFTGEDPYSLISDAASTVKRHYRTGQESARSRLSPDFLDLFGWCTWDAFYHTVDPDKIRQGLASFAEIGIEPRFLVLDDGWQSTQQTANGEERLTSFSANQQFDHDLKTIVDVAKNEFLVRKFLVWHALLGYWGGVCDRNLPHYDTRIVQRTFGPSVLAEDPDANNGKWGSSVGVPSAAAIQRFYDDYHQQLRAQGVDGVKVDSQATLEAVSAGQGGRVVLTRAYRKALERSVAQHFEGRMINCMSCTPEGLYLAGGGIMRSSDDFWPLRPETHGVHIYNNAHTSLWFGEFMQLDWDMFQSQHEFGSFHAAGRAVSGGPVYVSDQPGKHDAALLRKLVLSDGTVLRADHAGRLTRDCLFVNPATAPVLLKVFNTNRDCGVLGVFNAHVPSLAAGRSPLSGTVRPADIPTLAGEHFVSFFHRADRLERCDRNQLLTVELCSGEWEIISFAPIHRGFAAIGLADKLNSGGAIKHCGWPQPNQCIVILRDGGTLLAWSRLPPTSLVCDGQPLHFQHDSINGRLTCAIPTGGQRSVELRWM